MSRQIISGIIVVLVVLGIWNSVFSEERDSLESPSKLIIFYSPSCHKCIQAKSTLIPEIEKEFKQGLIINYLDVTNIDNYKLMLGFKERYAKELKIVLPAVYINTHFLNLDVDTLPSLRNYIQDSFLICPLPPQEEGELPRQDLRLQFLSLRPWAISFAGLVDGINPCAFTVIVFFVSFLALQGYRKRELVIIGLSFISAVFLTYLLLGLGIFAFLYHLKGFLFLIKVFNFSVGIMSLILALFCLYDFFQFRKTHKNENLTLQLPPFIKNQIHKIIGERYRVVNLEKRHIFKLSFVSLTSGFLISLLEAVCTGQLYLPTIAFVLKTTPLKLQALALLLLYNFMFILPLLIIFLLALWGVSSGAFSNFLRRHLLSIKLLMALLFFSLGIFLIWR